METPPGIAPDGIISFDDIAAVERLQGRPATTDAHRALLAPYLHKHRARLRALRTSTLASGHAPADVFRPLHSHASSERGAGMTLPTTNPNDWDGNLESLAWAPVTLLSALLQARRVSSRQLTELFLTRLKRYAPELCCVINRVPDDIALAEADRADAEIAAGNYRGTLHGIPYGAKDLFAVAGLPTTDGVSPFRDRVSNRDAEVITRLRNAGAVLLAKLSLGELAMGDMWFGGKTRNPWNLEMGASGSSAGSASAVAAGLVPFALGTETWGSIISPCNACGTTGLRPTFGRVPRTGASTLAWSMDKIGPIARSVADCAVVFEAIRGADGVDHAAYDAPFHGILSGDLSALRIGYDVQAWDALAGGTDEQRALLPFYNAAKREIEWLSGNALIPTALPPSAPEINAAPIVIIGVEGAASYAELIAASGLDALVSARGG